MLVLALFAPLFIWAVLLLAGLIVYLLPTWLAVLFDHPHALAIFLINLLLGWSFLGWVAALVWSLLREDSPIAYEEQPRRVA
jgi:hypothetical protein